MPPTKGEPPSEGGTSESRASPECDTSKMSKPDVPGADDGADSQRPGVVSESSDDEIGLVTTKHEALAADASADADVLLEPLLVVGLGASAGGLEALQTFFGHMPLDTGLAFVVVTHQPANRTSLLPLLLSKRTRMPVAEAVDGMRVRPNHVYVAPPGFHLGMLAGCLRVSNVDPGRSHPLPIDHFFRSLASDLTERAVGVVLSGTGSDGTLGLREIKAGLGLSVVQSEQDAVFAGMPHSAITGDSPDYVLPAAQIPAQLLAYLGALRQTSREPLRQEESERDIDALQHIFMLLRRRTGHDFSAYKASTVRRRIERRMNLLRIGSLPLYVRYLQGSSAELDILFDELLIGVTSFFRDADAFESLATHLRDYIDHKPRDYPLRAWVAGCSTGEEAYSVAILVREILEATKQEHQVQIFATDLDPKAIEIARAGVYPTSIAADVTPARLKRFFVPLDDKFQVRKDVREMLVFATQNLIEDPPFTKLDLFCCRNLLIYLDGSLQRRLFPIFHYVLKPEGILFLGSSETVGGFGHLFEPLDKKWRLQRRREVPGGTYVAEIPAHVSWEGGSTAQTFARSRKGEVTASQLADRALLRDLVPPTVLLHERGEIVHIHGRTGLFLEPAPGAQTTPSIFEMAREGLQLELAAAIRQAVSKGSEVVRQNVRVQSPGHATLVNIRVKQMTEPDALRGLLRVSFEHARPSTGATDDAPADPNQSESSRVHELERELQFTKERHQITIEELETANEELKSTNEEIQSTNEELQSANEELETSKEELQSLNEELHTVNLELQSKIEQLSRSNDDMTNLLNATDIATIFLDNDLNIKRHTEQAKRVIRLIPSDVGRSIGDLVSRLRYDSLLEDARDVLRTLAFKEAEVQGDGDNNWYFMRILPYRTTANVIDGLVITFVDITRVKLLQRSEQRLVHALRHSPVSVFGVTDSMRIQWACGGAFGHDASTMLGRTFDEVFGDAQPLVRALLEEVRDSGDAKRSRLQTQVKGRHRSFELFIEPQAQEGSSLPGATCVAIELTAAGGIPPASADAS